jgi:uncharacterized alpha/beta hydrolase family protein
MHAEIFWVVTSFVAQLFLCAIFWQLGTVKQEKKTEQSEQSDEAYPEIEVVDFDENAELQARIWN